LTEDGDYEIGYNWSAATKFENLHIHYGANGFVEEYWNK
jgi:hypothetical protein